MREVLSALAASTLLFACAGPPEAMSPAGAPDLEGRDLFHFHADRWSNLHEVLLHEAFLPRPGFAGPSSLAHQSVAPLTHLLPDEVPPWRDAVAYYDAHFSGDDLFTADVISAARGLAASGGTRALSAIPGVTDDWRAKLVAAEPIYRERFWPDHEREDLAYIDRMKPLVARHAAWFAQRLSALYETPWPGPPIDVEVTEVVPMFGARTFGEPPFTGSHAPLITVSCRDPGYAGASGVEMLFHESSHLLVDRVQGMLDESAKRQGKELPRGMWHFLLFFTAGRVAKERLGGDYLPYWERPEMQRKAPPNALPVLASAWQPYIDGRVTLKSAVDAVVAGM